MYKIVAILILAFASCTNTDSNATFTGFDSRKCGCCWGYEITLDNGEKVIGSKFPASLNEFTLRKFPFDGNIIFKKNANCENVIEIETFEESPK